MALTLAYDNQLSRVRIAADGLPDFVTVAIERSVDRVRWSTVRGGSALIPSGGKVQLDDYEFAPNVPNYYRVVGPSVWDTFGRTVSGGWGMVEHGGQAWSRSGGTATDYWTDGTAAYAACSAVNSSRFAALDQAVQDADVAVTIGIPVVATGTGNGISAGLRLRAADTNNYYFIELIWRTDATLALQLVSRVSASSTVIAGPVSLGTYTAGQEWRLRARLVGSDLRAKAWPASSGEPDAWMVQATTTSLTAAGQIGTRVILGTGNTNTLPVTATYRDFVVQTPTSVIDRWGLSGPAAGAPLIADSFGRSESNGWGTADVGGAWTIDGGNPSDFGVSGSAASIALPIAASSRRIIIGTDIADSDQVVTFTVPSRATGDSIDLGLMSRIVDSTSYYLAVLHLHADGTADVRIRKQVNGVYTTLAISDLLGTYSQGEQWRVRMQTVGSTLRAKAWPASGDEPLEWQAGAVDTSLPDPGPVGVRANLQANWSGSLPQVVAVDDYEMQAPSPVELPSIVPTIDRPWLKSVARPFLNRPLPEVESVSPISRPARVGVFDTQGRSMPIAVSSVRGSRRWDLTVITQDPDEARTLDLILASGDVLYLQVPPGSNVPSGYVAVGDSAEQRFPGQGGKPDEPRRIVLPLTEVAPPGPGVVGATVTWQTVINAYATWADVIDAHDTWASVATLVGDPEDVIVP